MIASRGILVPDTAPTPQQHAHAAQRPARAAPDEAAAASGRADRPRGARRLVARHWLIGVLIAGAAALRAVVMLGYPPAMWFNDAYSYVYDAVRLHTSTVRPGGYPVFLLLLEPLHSFTVVVACQHLMGLAMGAGIYAVLWRRGLPAWAAALAAVPVLYDAYQVQLEQEILSDVLFMTLVTAALVLLCWPRRLTVPAAASVGLLAGVATVVRLAGLPLLAIVAVCLLAWRAGWRPLLALLVAGAAPVVAYMFAFSAQHGQFTLTYSNGTFLYGRVQSFADCRVIKPPPSLARLCDPRPPAERQVATEYIWRHSDPLLKLTGHYVLFSRSVNAKAQAFAVRAIEAQPLTYLAVVNRDLWRSFTWSRHIGYDWRTEHLYQFSIPPPHIRYRRDLRTLRTYQPGLGRPRAVQPYAGFARAYQRVVYLRGTLLGLILLAGLAGLVARWRQAGGPGLAPWLVAVALLVFPVAVADFDYRYLLAVTPPACLAVGLAAAPRTAPPQGEAIRAS